MGINATELGELSLLARKVQRNINEHEKAKQELQPLLSRILTLTKDVPKDMFGDDLTDEQIQVNLQKTKELAKKCEKYMPVKDSSEPKPEEG